VQGTGHGRQQIHLQRRQQQIKTGRDLAFAAPASGCGTQERSRTQSTTTPKYTQKKKKKQRGVMLGNAQYLPHLPPLPVVSNNSNVQQQ
jgi:hypothetical protein